LRIIARPAFENRDRNPYNWLLYTRLREQGVVVDEYSRAALLRGDHDVWHLHWPEARLNVPSKRVALQRMVEQQLLIEWARRRGTKIVWTIHNLHTHEGRHPWLERLLWRALIPRLDGHISLSAAGQAAAVERFPRLAGVPGFVVPHGHYRDVYPNTVPRADARARLGIPGADVVLGFLGKIRAYKGVSTLLSAFRSLTDPHARLLVAGSVAPPETPASLAAAIGGDPRVHLHAGFVPESEVQLHLNASDLAVLPFHQILNSGSALLALSFDRPVLVPEMGAMAELQATVGRDWVRTYRGELTAGHLADAIRWVRETPRAGRAPLDPLGWDGIARRTAEAYRAIVGRRR
jgi:beta-1,4-mannosyltransferase